MITAPKAQHLKAQELSRRLGVSESQVQAVLADPKLVEQVMRQHNLPEEIAILSLVADQEIAGEMGDVVIVAE